MNRYKGDFSSIWKKWLREVSTSKVLTLFEPEKETIPNVRIGQSRFISRKIAKVPDDSFIQFSQTYGRGTTLAGIWMFLKRDHSREYLITAFGKRKGSGVGRPTQYYGLHISHGLEHEAKFSTTCIDYFQKHITRIKNAEVLVLHNHTRNIVTELLSQLIGWSPLPSERDRETLYKFKEWLVSGNFRNIHFYVVEHGRLREILLPPADRVVNALKALIM